VFIPIVEKSLLNTSAICLVSLTSILSLINLVGIP
jgi:hypothetical protein